jgi:lysophospholipid acyltransferase (LPLAT)-like uncharacterized protein
MGELIKSRWRIVRPQLVSGLLYSLVRLIARTLRFKTEGFPEDDHKAIICGWHGRSFTFANFFRNRGYWVVISHSKDGDMQNHIFTKLGYQVIRGSTGRGGARAAIEAIRALKKGGTMAMTPDGPRGPSHVVQGGVMLMAQKSGAALVPVGISARPRWLVNSWDSYMVPMPFAKTLFIFGDPIFVPPDADEETVENVRLQLESEMNRLEEEAERRMGHLPAKS